MSLKITLQPNDHLWSPQGYHVCDQKGFTIVCEEEIEVEFLSQEILDRVLPIIEERRASFYIEPEPGLPEMIEDEEEIEQ
jgi:hypothetical protein